ncbi:MAG: hypothetical protein ABSC25_20190 [Roseiarcus sp.]|jgi:hypothetical protein
MRASDDRKEALANHLHDLHRERRPDSMENRRLGSRLEAFCAVMGNAGRPPARCAAAPAPDLPGVGWASFIADAPFRSRACEWRGPGIVALTRGEFLSSRD